MQNLFLAHTRKEIETRRRIRLSVAACSYEFTNNDAIRPFMSDGEFDRESRLVDLSVNTNRPDMDAWFRSNFDPSTGVWVRQHPELQRIGEIYHEYYNSTN